MKSKKGIKLEVLRSNPDLATMLAKQLGCAKDDLERIAESTVTHRLDRDTYDDTAGILVLTPTDHRRVHGNYRERPATLTNLKNLVRDRNAIMRHANRIGNMLDANKRFEVPTLQPESVKYYEQQLAETQAIARNRYSVLVSMVTELGKKDPLIAAALNVHAVGPVTVAYCAVYIDPVKATHASKAWRYAGLDVPSHERYVSGEKSGGNKNLRTALYNMADSQVKHRGPYRRYYDEHKARKAESDVLTKTRIKIPDQGWKLVEMPWKDVRPMHRDGHGMRIICKRYLADWVFVARDLDPKLTPPVQSYMDFKHGHQTIFPRENGWEW